jgi:hypothetical protein
MAPMPKAGRRRNLGVGAVAVVGAAGLGQARVAALAQARLAFRAPHQAIEAVSPSSWPVPVQTFGLLLLSNLFMTFAWYGHLKNLSAKPWWVAAVVSWGIALFEYLLQVPANRIGHAGGLSLAQLKIGQEVLTLLVFVPFAVLYMGEPLKLDYLWAGLCLVGAVYFIFRAA